MCEDRLLAKSVAGFPFLFRDKRVSLVIPLWTPLRLYPSQVLGHVRVSRQDDEEERVGGQRSSISDGLLIIHLIARLLDGKQGIVLLPVQKGGSGMPMSHVQVGAQL